MHNIGLLSNRVKKVPAAETATVAPDRYQYLDLNNAEPDWGVPDTDLARDLGINRDTGLAASSVDGTRKWVVLGSGLQVDEDNKLNVDDSAFVTLAGDQEFSGTKTFLDNIIIGETDSTDTGEKLRVDGVVSVESLTTQEIVFNLVDTVAETINFGGAGTDINIGSTFGTTTVNNDLVVKGDIIIEGGQPIDGGFY